VTALRMKFGSPKDVPTDKNFNVGHGCF